MHIDPTKAGLHFKRGQQSHRWPRVTQYWEWTVLRRIKKQMQKITKKIIIFRDIFFLFDWDSQQRRSLYILYVYAGYQISIMRKTIDKYNIMFIKITCEEKKQTIIWNKNILKIIRKFLLNDQIFNVSE